MIPNCRIFSDAVFSSTTRSTSVKFGTKTSLNCTRFPLFVTHIQLPCENYLYLLINVRKTTQTRTNLLNYIFSARILPYSEPYNYVVCYSNRKQQNNKKRNKNIYNVYNMYLYVDIYKITIYI